LIRNTVKERVVTQDEHRAAFENADATPTFIA
jgi:hypothetical protein